MLTKVKSKKSIIVFDLDDTLFPEFDYIKSGFEVVGKKIDKKYKLKGFYEIALNLFSQGERGKIFNHALEKYDINQNQIDINELVETYRAHLPEICLFDDAEWALNYFANQSLFLISDGYLISQQNKLKALKIENIFEKIILTDLLGKEYWKPNVISYKMVMALYPLEDVVFYYIGDNPRKDFVSPNRLGWETIQIWRENSIYGSVNVDRCHQAKYKINNLKQLENLIEI